MTVPDAPVSANISMMTGEPPSVITLPPSVSTALSSGWSIP